VTLHIADGSSFIQDAANESQEIIIQYSPDPYMWDGDDDDGGDDDGGRVDDPSGILFTTEHVKYVFMISSKDRGLIIRQRHSTFPLIWMESLNGGEKETGFADAMMVH